jgi:hypothetical protein
MARSRIVLLASIWLAATSSALAADSSGIVAEWRFDEGRGDVARDSSGNGNDLKLQGATFTKDGEGFSISLDGLGAYAGCALSDSLRLTQSVSVEAWVKPVSQPWAEPDIFGASSGEYQVGYSNRGSCWWFVMSQGNEVGGKLKLGKWNHVVGTFDGKSRSLWLNGQLAGTRDAKPLKGQGGKFLIGSTVAPYFHGMLDRLRVYNRALTSDEAIAHYRDEAGDFGVETQWFTRVKVQPYYYFDRGEVVVDADYSAMMPLAGKGKLDVTLSSQKSPDKALQGLSVDPLPSWGSTQVTIPLRDVPNDEYLIRIALSDGKGDRPADQKAFSYPPPAPTIPPPAQQAVGALPSPTAQIPFSVELTTTGGFRLRIKETSYPFATRVSWPKGEFNHLSPDDVPAKQGEKSWNVSARDVQEGRYEADASGDFYKLRRSIEVLPTHVSIEDTYTNTTDQDLGLLVYNELALKDGQVTGSRLCGYEGAGRCVDVLSPHYGGASVFVRDSNTGLGMLPMDDVYVVQSLLYIEKNLAGMATEKLALPPHGSYTLKWAIYPTGSGDYWDFINTYRKVNDGIGTVHGGLGFISYGPKNRHQLPSRDFMENRGMKVGIIHGMSGIADDPGLSIQGFEFIDFPLEKRALADQASIFHATHPDAKIVFHIAHTLYCTNKPDRFADSKLTLPNGKQRASGGPADFSRERMNEGWAYHVFYPTPGNSYHDAMMKSVDVMMDEMGFDGAFVDGFMLGYGGRWTYDRWDGHSAEIDPKTKTIKRKLGSVLLLMQPSMIEYARKIRDKGGICIANGNVLTPTITKEKYIVWDAECQAGPESHLAPSAMSLAWGPFSSEKELYLDVLDKLSWGVLYMFYNERIPLTYPSLPAKQFPITFEEIRAGMVRGPQRIVTMNSGVYGWPNDQRLHQVFKFDGRGAPAPHQFVSTIDSDGVRTELRFAEHESAVIERIPVSICSARPVNVSVQDYKVKQIRMLLNGDGEVTLSMFVGTDYPDRREGVFTNGGVARIDVGVADDYRITINGNTTAVKERDAVLSVPLKLNGQTALTIAPAEKR